MTIMPDARSGLIAALLLTTSAVAAPTGNEMNPAISLILQAHYADYDRDPEGYELPGFQLGGEAGLAAEGFGLGHSELLVSANIDDRFRGNLTVALAEHEGATEVELEEAYIETLGLPVVRGVTVKAGRFFSNLGYLNNQHTHAWDFTDAPLVYRGLFGDQLIDDGIQVRWLAPGVLFVQIGVELGRGERFPAGGARKGGRGSQVAFAEFGGDVGVSHSWQMGISRWSAEIEGRESGGHSHGGATEVPAYTGDSSVTALDLVWKWAPNGNYRDRNLKLQFEYLRRHEHGSVAMLGSAPLEEAGYDGKQRGWYLQAVYQFRCALKCESEVREDPSSVRPAHPALHLLQERGGFLEVPL